MKLSNFFTRALAGAAYVALVIVSLITGNIGFGILCTIILAFSFDEYFKLMKRIKINGSPETSTIFAVILFVLLILYKNNLISYSYLFLLPFSFIVLMIIQLLGKNRNPITNVAISCFAFIYIFVPYASLYLLGFYNMYTWNNDFNYELLLGFFILIWTSDTGAYLVGSVIGKNKLIERISPKKTIEGSIGALVLTSIVAYFISMYLQQVSLLDWAIISLIVVVFGTAGDLFESMIKRKADLKDSGNIIPGHGGILDRFDSILFAAPVVYIYLHLVGH